MAVSQTGAAFKSLIFDGKYSRDYGVYITGEAVFNAPEREVEMISIPGRNGAFALDKGRFNNIEVTYPAGIFAGTENDFAEAISNFRNMLCSRKGYVRFEDEYNPNEYRMAVYKSGLEVEPAMLKAGQFNITFDCKPQRYLTDGETAVSVSDGDTLTNPTLFEAHPLIALTGYGSASINGYGIEIKDQLMGAIELQHGWMGNEAVGNGLLASFYDKIDLPSGLVNVGDTITAGMTATVRVQTINRTALKTFGTPTSVRVTDGQGQTISGVSGTAKSATGAIECTITLPASYDYGDPTQSLECELHFTITPTDGEGSTAYGSFECYVPVKFWQLKQGKQLWLIADVGAIEAVSTGLPTYVIGHYTKSRLNLIVRDVNVDSTAPAYGEPTYIDCELGEIYKETDGDFVSLNRYVSLGSRLPELSAGDNEITFESTFSEAAITPRWWKV